MDKNRLAVKMFNEAALIYEEKYMDVSSYAGHLDLLCSKLGNKQASILELASGPGNIAKYLYDKCSQHKILGTDLAPAMVELAKINCPAADFQVLDCREISKLQKTFDSVIASFCFPYLNKNEVHKLILDIHQVLKPDGLLYLSTIDGSYSDSGMRKSSTSKDDFYLYLYDADFMEKTLMSSGFEVLLLRTQPETTLPTVTNLIIIAKKI